MPPDTPDAVMAHMGTEKEDCSEGSQGPTWNVVLVVMMMILFIFVRVF
jgi:hypothetical protein